MPVAAVVVVAVFALAGGAVIGLVLARRRPSRRRPGPGLSAPTPAAVDAVPALVLDALTQGVVVVDREERTIIVNPAARAMGVADGDRVCVPGLSELARAATSSAVAQLSEIDLGGERPGRPAPVVSVTAVPLPEHPGGARVAAVALLLDDVSEYRRLDAVRRDFVANVSHELKTPVGALTLLAEAVIEAADDPEAVQRFAGRMQHEGARLGKLVRELIELSRLQGAEPLPGDGLVLITRVLDEAADRTRLAAERDGISVRVSCPDDLVVRGNESQLTMAIANLIDNAIAYSPTGTRVAVSARASDDVDGVPQMEISVSDQGIGIAEADLNRVFERFYRVDPARSRATGGTGLGLAIVKHVASNHGGSVSVWSVEGAGSTFTIRLPRVHPIKRSSGLDAPPAAGQDEHIEVSSTAKGRV